MAGVVRSEDITDFVLANIPAKKVSSSTRFNWSRQEVSTFESFISDRLTSTSQSQQKINAVDLGPLLSALHLDRFLTIKNTNGEPLCPIIETKVRRKLASVSTSMKQKHHDDARQVVLPGQDRTRLQAARTRAIAAGEEPPTRLPLPDPIYIPETWKPRPKKSACSSTTTAPVAVDTFEKARKEVIRLEKALALARANLARLQQQEEQAEVDHQFSQEQQLNMQRYQSPGKKKAMSGSPESIQPSPHRLQNHHQSTCLSPETGSDSDNDYREPSDSFTVDTSMSSSTSRASSVALLSTTPRRGRAIIVSAQRHGSPSALGGNTAKSRGGESSRSARASPQPVTSAAGPEFLKGRRPRSIVANGARLEKYSNDKDDPPRPPPRIRHLSTANLTLSPSSRTGLQEEDGSGDEDDSDRELSAHLKRLSQYLNSKYEKDGAEE